MTEDKLYQSALDYHQKPKPGKLEVIATKPLANQRDLALAYSPGVAAACEEIVDDPQTVSQMTSRGNLVAVITNGTAVLGLGDIGPLASKPVMEGKAVLFKKFAGIDVFDIEIDEKDPEQFVQTVKRLEPTFGAINLEDIRAPECFEIETKLMDRMKIPVFHDDQHGTAIIVAAAVLNGLKLMEKSIHRIKLVTAGGGAAAISCLNLLMALGLEKKNVTITDLDGVVYEGREGLSDPYKLAYAQETDRRTLEEAIEGADIFLGLSAGGVLKPEMVKKMAKNPLILALANPIPEIDPHIAQEVRPDAVIATGRSDYPNQVNNVLCFPYIFRGALDVGATEINLEMKLACVHALAALAMAEPSDVVSAAYEGAELSFGPDYLIPKPFDPRLILELAPAVARAAMDTGVATAPIEDFGIYRQKLTEFVFRSGLVMKPVFNRAKKTPKRVVFAEGEDTRVLRAIQVAVDERIAEPIIIGRRDVVASRIRRLGLRLQIDRDYTLVDPQDDPRYKDYCDTYHELMHREGVSPDYAKIVLRTNTTVIAAIMVHKKEADAMLSGPIGRFERHLEHILAILGPTPNVHVAAALSGLVLNRGTFFICDSYVNINPSAEELAEITVLAAQQVKQFGFQPKIALLSHSCFGSNPTESAQKMQRVLGLVNRLDPDLEIEGEMHADAALNENIRERIFPNCKLKGTANLLVMPSLEAANIAYNLTKVLGEGQPIGPILLGVRQPAHILTPSATVRSIVNMTAMAVVDAQLQEQNEKEVIEKFTLARK